ncbi:MAG: MBL fold metallo-hydrolase [Actinobacteria bacterium]|nr:MBL fold metallo-hydrolase [Actinomycetota bacterium]
MHGISSAVQVEDKIYVVDCGEGSWSQYRRAFAPESPFTQTLSQLRSVFLTHLHSDHTVDYNNLLLLGGPNGLNARATNPVNVYGPGERGSLPPVYPPGRPAPPVMAPQEPTPGTATTTTRIFEAYSSDFNDRMRDGGQPDPRTRILAHDIPLPASVIANANVDPAPDMQPISVYEDEVVKVTATLVNHRPTFPSFGFRFDTADGSIVFSGDTAPEKNLVELAKGADILVHEAIDPNWIASLFPNPNEPGAEAIIHHLLTAHTTIEQVGVVAQEAGVKTLVLNHINAGTSHGRWMEANKNFSGEVIVGEDLMRVGVGRRHRRSSEVIYR